MKEQMAASLSKASKTFSSIPSFAGKQPLTVPAILHPFLGQGSPQDVPGQVFYGGFIPGECTRTEEDLEPGMSPVGKYGDQVLGNPPFGQGILKTLCRKMASSFFRSRGGAIRTCPSHRGIRPLPEHGDGIESRK